MFTNNLFGQPQATIANQGQGQPSVGIPLATIQNNNFGFGNANNSSNNTFGGQGMFNNPNGGMAYQGGGLFGGNGSNNGNTGGIFGGSNLFGGGLFGSSHIQTCGAVPEAV